MWYSVPAHHIWWSLPLRDGGPVRQQAEGERKVTRGVSKVLEGVPRILLPAPAPGRHSPHPPRGAQGAPRSVSTTPTTPPDPAVPPRPRLALDAHPALAAALEHPRANASPQIMQHRKRVDALIRNISPTTLAHVATARFNKKCKENLAGISLPESDHPISVLSGSQEF